MMALLLVLLLLEANLRQIPLHWVQAPALLTPHCGPQEQQQQQQQSAAAPTVAAAALCNC
jgi:hypothetical protein